MRFSKLPTFYDKGFGMAYLEGWPEWLAWCGVGAGAVLAGAIVVYVVEAALEMTRQ